MGSRGELIALQENLLASSASWHAEKFFVPVVTSKGVLAIPSQCVRSIQLNENITMIPGVKPPLCGVTFANGVVHLIYDLNRIVAGFDSEPGIRSRIVFINSPRTFALRVGRVLDIVSQEIEATELPRGCSGLVNLDAIGNLA